LIFISICIVLVPTVFLSGDVGTVGDFLKSVPPLKFDHVIRGNTFFTFWYLIGIPAAYIFQYSIGPNAQRYYSVVDENAAKKAGWLAFILFAMGPILFGGPPLIGKVLWPDIGMLDYFAGITKPDENIFIAVVMKYMPAGMVGIFLAAMMSASMSAMDSAWNAVSSIISIDIYKAFFNPKASDKQVLFVGRLAMIFFAGFAVAMALTITHSEYGVFTFSNIFFGLTGIPIAVPIFLGLVIKRVSRWSAISSILVGTIIASVARFGMKYTLGPQYILTVAVTLLYFLISDPIGRLYIRDKLRGLFANIGLGIFLWLFFMTVNTNPNLSLDTMGSVFSSGVLGILGSSHFWLLIAAIAITTLAHLFSKLYATDLQADQSEVTAFFEKLETPVDVQKEVIERGAKEANIFPLVGGIAMGLALLSLLLMLAPAGRTSIGVNLAVSSILFVIGLVLFLSKKAETLDSESTSD
jgi:Na+/proline symporter